MFWRKKPQPPADPVVSLKLAQEFWNTQLEWVVQQMNARDVFNARPLREAIIRLNERFEALGENIDLRGELTSLRSEVAELNRNLEDLRSQTLGRENAHVETAFDRAMYEEMGIKD